MPELLNREALRQSVKACVITAQAIRKTKN